MDANELKVTVLSFASRLSLCPRLTHCIDCYVDGQVAIGPSNVRELEAKQSDNYMSLMYCV